MKYIYNSFFLFVIMLAVLWFGSGSRSSELAGAPTRDARASPSAEHASFRQVESAVARDE